MEEDMSAALAQAFSLVKFTVVIQHLSKDKAPGLSMVNSNMIKAWDAGMITYVHSMMQVLWEHKTIPIWWRDHGLSPDRLTHRPRCGWLHITDSTKTSSTDKKTVFWLKTADVNRF
jgi:hypothetical protein